MFRHSTDPKLEGDEVGVGMNAVHPLVKAMNYVAVVIQCQNWDLC